MDFCPVFVENLNLYVYVSLRVLYLCSDCQQLRSVFVNVRTDASPWPHNITRSPVKYFHRLDHRPFPFGYSVNDVGNLYFNLLKTSSIMNKKCLPNSRLSLVFSAPPSSKCVSSRVSNVDFFRSFCKSSFTVDGIFTSIM